MQEKKKVDFPGGAVVKNPPANAGDTGSIHRKKEINRKPRLDSLDKDFKSTVLNILKEIKEIMDKRTKGNQENDVSSNREYQ